MEYDTEKGIKRVGVFGTGNLGSDLILKILEERTLSLDFVVGRRNDSPGVEISRQNNVKTYVNGLSDLKNALKLSRVDWVADVSTASVHADLRSVVFQNSSAQILDLTPSILSEPFSPSLGLDSSNARDISLISCGGQSALPIISKVRELSQIEELELTSSLAARSVGPGTRANIDEYIKTTSSALSLFSGAKHSKVILVINPAEPPINMRVTLYIRIIRRISPTVLKAHLLKNYEFLKKYIPNFALISVLEVSTEVFQITYEVTGQGLFLPPYAGNLDILTRNAIATMTGKLG